MTETEVQRTMDELGCTRAEAEEHLFNKEIEDGYRSNAPCDNSGYCIGMACKHYFKCQS